MTADEAGSDKNGKKNERESEPPGELRGKDGGDEKKPSGGQEYQPESEAPVLDGSATVEVGLAQALRPLSFESEVKWCTGMGQTETK